MLKLKLIIGAIILMHGVAFKVLAQDASPKNRQFRQQLLKAVNSAKTTDSLYTALSRESNKSPLINGYLATLQALQAKHSWNPYVKLKQMNNAEKTFTKAIVADPHNLELRFMRYSVEYHLPKFLGLSNNMVADKQEIFDRLNNKQNVLADKDLVIAVINFLLQTESHTPAQKIDLNKQLAALQ